MPELGDKLVVIVVESMLADPEVLPEEHFEKGLKYLYNCLKRMPHFKDGRVWKTLPTRQQLLGHIETLFNEATKPYFKTIFRYHTERQKFVMVTYHEMRMEDSYVLPLDWLPLLQKRNDFMYRCVVNVLAKVASAFRLDIFYNSYNDTVIYSPGDYGQDDDEVQNHLLQYDVMAYQKGGEAYQYAKMLRNLGNLDLNLVERMVMGWKPIQPFEKKVKKWLLLGLESLPDARAISLYVFPDVLEAETGAMPLTCVDHMCFMWSFHDIVFHNTDQYMESTGQEYGQVGPMIETVWNPNSTPRALSEEPVKRLMKFLRAGRSIYFRHYNQRIMKMRERHVAAAKMQLEEYGIVRQQLAEIPV